MAKNSPGKGKQAKKNTSQAKDASSQAKDSSLKAKAAPAQPKRTPAKTKAASTKAKSAPSKAKGAPKKENLFRRIATYFHNVRLEIKRTTWPSKNEVLRMSMIVFGALLFFGVFIFIADWIMTNLLDLYSQFVASDTGGGGQ
jgi:preprotein translocase subunit SecE